MKKTDIAMIILIASMSVLIAYFIASTLFGGGKTESVKIKTADPISAEIIEPDATVFNKDAVNPTVEVTIGGNAQSTE